MKRGHRAVAVVVLVSSLFVLGTLSSSLGATVTTTPDDAIDVDTDKLPFMGEGASEIADSYERAEQGDTQRQVGGAEGESGGASGEPSQQERGEGEGGEGEPAEPQGQTSGAGAQDANDRQGDRGDRGAGQGPGEGAGGGDRSWWSLFQFLLTALLALLALLVLLAALLVLYRRRDRILAALRALAARYGLLSAGPGRTPATAEQEDPSTVVEYAWDEVIRHSGTRPPRSDTPRECARAAIAAGLDREPVDGLTELYERVRYGGQSVTPEDAGRALEWMRSVVDDAGHRVVDAEFTTPERPSPSPGETTLSDGGRHRSSDRGDRS